MSTTLRKKVKTPAPGSEPSAASDDSPSVSRPRPKKLRRWLFAGFAVLLVSGFAWWEAGGNDRFVPKRFGVVVPGKIYRSGQISKWLIEDVLVHHKIGMIVDFTNFDWYDEFQQYELSIAWKYKIAVNRYPQAGDGTGDIKNYAQALKTLVECDRKGTPVLVHCAAGSQRTGAAIAFYRVLIQKKSPDEALREMRRYDCEPEENGRLLRYINSHMEQLARLLVELKVLDKMPSEIPQLNP